MIDRRPFLIAVVALGTLGAVAAGSSPHRPAATPPPAPPPPRVVTATSRPPPPAVRAPGPAAVGRIFAAAYVAFVYGRLGAARLPDASPYVRRQAAGLHPAPPPAVLAVADPRVRSLRLVGRARSAATVLVVITDGALLYDVVLDLRRLPAGWTITGLRETG